ncbi:MAG: disulfide oxidoreductase [Patescibacteria group bacterium]
MKSITTFLGKNALYLALVQTIIATLGSLYFSEIAKYPPCFLCWWQRIAMYPIIIILTVGILRRDREVYQYVLPLTIIGWAFSLYHNLLYYHILPWWNEPCAAGVSCTTKYISWFGFLTIPLLAFIGFNVIIGLMFLYRRHVRQEQQIQA